ncbi:unnamed protein product [Prunus armeniaca]
MGLVVSKDGCNGSVSDMGSDLQRGVVRWGSVVCRDGGSVVSRGFCDGKGIGVGLDIRWGEV